MMTLRTFHKTLLFAGISLCTAFGPPSKTEKQYLSRVSGIFDKLNAAASNSKNACYINYTVTAQLNAKNNKEKNLQSKSTYELISFKGQSRVSSPEVIVLKDEKNTFTILPSRKTIYWADAVKGKKNDNIYGKLKQMQDTIFNNATKVECAEVSGKAYDQVITIYLNDKIANYIDIRKVVYHINAKQGLLNKVYVEYLPDRQYEKVEYAFNEMDLDYTKADMSTPVKALVFDGKSLQKQYLGYKLIDNRKK
jgi:hypothetical protein